MCNFAGLLATFLSLLYSVQGVNYIGVDGSATWQEAKDACQDGVYVKISGGKLATWDSYNQYRDGVRLAATSVGAGAWVGLTDDRGDGTDGYWYLIDDPNTNRQSMNEWSSGQPDDYSTGQDCAYVWQRPTKTGDANGLDDGGCGARMDFVCEFASVDVPYVGSGKQEVVTVPDVGPLQVPDDGRYYYVFEMSSQKDVVTLLSVVMNVVCISIICCLVSKKARGSYSKVSMYSTDDDKI